jgi:predicted GH43/DUF377 family glycosyl hydrolase
MTGWELGPFVWHDGSILREDQSLTFTCRVLDAPVAWAAKDVFNPGAVVHEGKVHLLVRAEDNVGRFAGTSRIGLATSDDGRSFELEREPVLYPDDDEWQPWEWPGGCEDPRVVEHPSGGFVCLYTAFDGKTGTLFVATSDDLRTWNKRGPAFAGTAHVRRSSKSGAVVTEVIGNERTERLVAAKIAGRFWMYWGEGIVYAATSDDLIHWQPLEFDATGDRYLTTAADGAGYAIHRVEGQRVLRPVLFPRRGRFDSLLAEPGPPAILTEHGVVLIYNGANHPSRGDTSLRPFSYQPGQALFDPQEPASAIGRPTESFLRAGSDERVGQVNDVCFAQGLVLFRDEWLLYVGMADSRIGSASAHR